MVTLDKEATVYWAIPEIRGPPREDDKPILS